MMDMITWKIIDWLRGLPLPKGGLLVPVSGGTDSALCFSICSKAYPGRVLGVYVDGGKSIRESKWFSSVGQMMTIHQSEITGVDPETVRWAMFLTLSAELNRALVGSRNRSEDEFGTYSLASRVATILPLVQMWKSDVIRHARYFGVPESVIASSSRADPDCGRPQQMADISLEKIDTFLKMKAGEQGVSASYRLTDEEYSYLDGIYRHNSFKSRLPYRYGG
jgi:NH3-dependent NAD+ synthetase